MDFFTMKRKKLQDLCKKHRIPANKTNQEMALKLSLIYKGKEEDPITIEDTDDERDRGIGKFLAMKRKELQDLCKKHGIPANWKSKKMAEKLSLIYKEKEDTNVSNINAQMEASDNAPGKESNADGKVGNKAEEQNHNNSSDKTGLVEEVITMCRDTSIGLEDTDGKTNVTAEDILDEAVSQKLVTLAPGTDTKSADTCDVEETMSMRASSEKMIDSSPKLISNSETTIDDLGVCDVDENMQISSNTEQVDHIHEVLLEEPSMVVMKDDEDLQQVTSEDLQVADLEICDMEVNVQLCVNKGQVDHSQEVFHTKPSEDIQVHDMGFSNSEVNMQIGVNEEQGDHCQEVVVVMKDSDDLVQVVSEDTQVDDMGFSDEEENMQIGVNEELVNYSQEVLHAEANFPDNAPGKKIAEHFLRNHKMVASEKNLQEGVNQEKVDDNNQEQHPTAPCSDAHVVSGEAETQYHNNSPDVTLLHTSLKESSGLTGLAEQVNNLDENITEASTMCLDKSIGVKDFDGKTNVIVEDILNEVNSDGTPVQFQLTDPLGEETPILNDAHKIVAPGTDTKIAVTCEAKFVSSQKISMSPASEKMIESSLKLTSDSETAIDDMGLGDVEENLHIVVNKDKVDHCQEVLHEEPIMVTSQDAQVADIGHYDMEENIQLGDYKGQVDHSQEVFHTKPNVVFMNEDLVQVSEDMQVGVNKEQADHSQKVLHEESSMVVMKDDDDDLQQVTSKDLQFSDMGVCDMEENMQLGVNKGQVDHSQEVFHTSSSVVFMNEDLVQVVSEHTHVDDIGFSDMEENLQIGIMHEMDALDNTPGKESDADGKKVAEHFLKNPKMVASEENMQLGVNKEEVDHAQEVFHTKTIVSEDMQVGVNKDKVDHSQEVLHAEPSVVVMKDDDDLLSVASQDLQVADMELCDMDENMQLGVNKGQFDDIQVDNSGFSDDMQIGVNEDQVDHSQEVLHAEPSVVVMKDKNYLVHVASEDIKVSDIGFSDVEENIPIGVNGDHVCYSQEILNGEPSVVVMKDDEDCVKVASEDTQVNEEQVNYSQEILHAESNVMLMKDDEDSAQVALEDTQVNDMGLCAVEENMDALDADTCEEMLNSSQKTGQIADQEDCIGYFSNHNLKASVSKDFEAKTYFDPSTLGDVEETMNEIMQSGKMEKENSQEECSFNRLFENSDIHDDTSGIGAQNEKQHYMMSHKRKWNDMDDTNGLDSAEKEKADGFVSTMTQLGEMESCDFNLHQIFASGTAYGDEATCYQEKLESPPKGTPIESSKKSIIFTPKFHGSSMMNKGLENDSCLPLISASDMKENIKIDKKDQVGSVMSKSKFAKRQPLQDLQQN